MEGRQAMVIEVETYQVMCSPLGQSRSLKVNLKMHRTTIKVVNVTGHKIYYGKKTDVVFKIRQAAPSVM